MKIKIKEASCAEVLARKTPAHHKPVKPSKAMRLLLRTLSDKELRKVDFSYEPEGLERLRGKEPCLILMNHSSFVDLPIAQSIFRDRPIQIVCTLDALVGKAGLMRSIGCIPTRKFVMDVGLLKDMKYSLEKLRSSVLLFPEAGYSFDGTATVLPDSLGKCLKFLNVPVLMVRTYGAFTRDPLYNALQLRKVKVSAKVSYFLSPEEIRNRSVEELNSAIREAFSFDNFRWQQENRLPVTEPFRADHLNRVLYKCPHCLAEGMMEGKGTRLTCHACGKAYELTEYGEMKALTGETEISHIPDWYRWERECVRKELEEGAYALDIPVSIYMMVDYSALYRVGTGRLIHSTEGFHLTGCDGALDYVQKPTASYSLNADYYWYEIGDVISIGDRKALYYCFTEPGVDVVAKTRLATEELYRMSRR